MEIKLTFNPELLGSIQKVLEDIDEQEYNKFINVLNPLYDKICEGVREIKYLETLNKEKLEGEKKELYERLREIDGQLDDLKRIHNDKST